MSPEEARAILGAVGRSPVLVLQALRAYVGLSDFTLSGVVGRSAQTVRRWRNSDVTADIPDPAAVAIEDLRAIVAMLVEADYSGDSIKSFLRSRNTGLGRDRPLDGVNVGVGAFRRVEHVTECFIAGIAPEPGPAFTTQGGARLEAAVEPPVQEEPDLPRRSAGGRR